MNNEHYQWYKVSAKSRETNDVMIHLVADHGQHVYILMDLLRLFASDFANIA